MTLVKWQIERGISMQRSKKEWCMRIVLLLVGLIVAHLGVTMFLISELGADTFTIFVQGLAKSVGVTIGTMHVIVLCSITLLMLIFARGYIKIGSIVCAVFGGWIIDFFIMLFDKRINIDSPMTIRVGIMIIGCFILSMGMSLVIKSDAGTGPNDLIAIIFTDKLKRVEFRWVRMSCDVVFIVLGLLLGGTIGVGTVVAAILIGPIVQWFLPKSERLVVKVIGNPVEIDDSHNRKL